jgi:hypothetical protein
MREIDFFKEEFLERGYKLDSYSDKLDEDSLSRIYMRRNANCSIFAIQYNNDTGSVKGFVFKQITTDFYNEINTDIRILYRDYKINEILDDRNN